jgi:SRSO17 transposase
VRITQSRWKVEQDYQQLQEELGLDHYQGRSWKGWHHHVTLVMLAHAFLTLEGSRSKKTSGWTLPQTRREIQRLLFTWTGNCAYCGGKIGERSRGA